MNDVGVEIGWKESYRELFDVECYRDLEMWIRGHSRSLKMAPFKRLDAVFYSPCIVITGMSGIICKI